MELRDYQDGLLRDMLRHLQVPEGEQEFLLSSPTGSGKTLMIKCLVEFSLRTQGYKRALVVTPQIQIEDGFISKEDLTLRTFKGNLEIFASSWERARESTQDVDAFLSAKVTSTHAMVTTHAGVVRWSKDDDFLPSSLQSYLLVVDEAHRAGESNQLGDFVKAWKERRGKVLHVTATPFRTDGAVIIPEDIRRFTRTMAEHADGKHAPEHLKLRALPLTIEAKNYNQYNGSVLGSAHGTACDEILTQWLQDCKPKTVIIVPQRGSQEWAALLETKLTKAGIRVFNAVGADYQEEDASLTKILGEERGVKDYGESKYDVILACKRFDEGTDWPLCSHVYNIGVPKAFNLILQRWGRAMRCKIGIKGYPKTNANRAVMTFFVPRVSDEVWAKFKGHHKDHVFLLGCFLHDVETAEQYKTCLRWRPEDVARRRGKSCSDLLLDVQSELMGLGREEIRTRAIRTTLDIESALRSLGETPTLGRVLEYAEQTLKLSSEKIQEIQDYKGSQLLLSEEGFKILERVEQRLEHQRRGVKAVLIPTSVIRKELREAFNEVISLHENEVITIAEGVQGYYGKLTGRDAQRIAEDLRERLAIPGFTQEEIKKAILGYFELEGKAPSAHWHTDASIHFGMPPGSILWNTLNRKISSQGASLFHICAELGLTKRATSHKVDLSLEQIDRAIVAYHTEKGKTPSIRSIESASPYLGITGITITWSTLDHRLRKGLGDSPNGSNLLVRAKKLGLLEDRDLTLDEIKEGVRKFYAEEGHHPPPHPIDASKYFGFPITWTGINGRLIHGYKGLSKAGNLVGLCKSMGLVKEPPPIVKDAELWAAVEMFTLEHRFPPGSKSGDASHYLGFPANTISWQTLNSRLTQGYKGTQAKKSLHRVILDGVKDLKPLSMKKPMVLNPHFTLDDIKRAVQKFTSIHGKPPMLRTGDASEYFGLQTDTITWIAINARLKRHHEIQSLTGLIKKMELDQSAPAFTRVVLEGAIKAFHQEYGSAPHQKSGDASKYIGFERSFSWAAVDYRLRQHFSTRLSAVCSDLGLIQTIQTFKVECIKEAIRSFYSRNGCFPLESSGDASPYLKVPPATISWQTITSRLRGGYKGMPKMASLHQLCLTVNLD